MRVTKIIAALIVAVNFMNPYLSAQDVSSAVYKPGSLQGKMIDGGFYPGDSNYHALVHASDGSIYYAICSHDRNTHVHLFRYDPETDEVAVVADIGEELGEDGTVNIPQGKIHCDLFEYVGKLYFGTHVGSYKRGGTKDHGPYPGGHFMSYDLATGTFEDYGIGEPEEGMVSLQMDKKRGRLYTLTWPSAIFVYYDLKTGTKKSFGPSVHGHAYINNVEFGGVPRSLGIDPRNGNVYWYTLGETVSCYSYDSDTIEVLSDHKLGRPILKIHRPGSDNDKVSWRSIRWREADNLFYGITSLGEQLISYDPQTGSVEVIDRIAPGPNRKSGELSGASLAYDLSSDGKTFYYVNHLRPSTSDTKKWAVDELHLVTYDVTLRNYTDHGPIVLEDGRKPKDTQGMEIGRDGNIYLVCSIPLIDMASKKFLAIKEIRHKATPTEQLKRVYEVNLVVIKNPVE